VFISAKGREASFHEQFEEEIKSLFDSWTVHKQPLPSANRNPGVVVIEISGKRTQV
jgi:hypothetical protein